MKNKLLLFFVPAIFLFSPNINFAQTPVFPNFGQAASFAVFTGAGAYTNTGLTTVTGNTGNNVGGFFGVLPIIIAGSYESANALTAQAATDVATVYTYLSTLTPDSVIATPTLGNGQVLMPKVYKIGSAATINGDLILDGQNNPNAKFVFQIGGAFAPNATSRVLLINGASLCNVYWTVEGAFASASLEFRGNLVATNAISLASGATLTGRALSREGAINLNTNVVTIGPAPPVRDSITANGAVTICLGANVTLSGNTAGVWVNLLTTASINVVTSGDYFVTNTNACGTVISNHIIVTVNPIAKDYGDLQVITWPVASAGVPGCQVTVNAPILYDAITNPNTSVWAGAGRNSEPAPAGGGNTSASTDNFDDGLGVPSIPLNGGYTYNFTVDANANRNGTQVFYRIWFDWNADGNFANDQSIQVGSNTLIPATYEGSGMVTIAGTPVSLVVPVKPPFGASPSYKLRLLVSDVAIPDFYRTNSSTYVIDMPAGEVEDYSAPAVILPITFGKISAEVKNCNVYLAFETLTEQNNKQFEVEYSTNGNSWKIISVLPGKGNSNSPQVYNYIHHQPASEYNYYRIKQVDKNGNYGYSSMVTVRANCVGAGSIVSYPNPVKDVISVVLPSGLDKANIKLVNAVGQSLATTTTLNGGTVTINTSLLSRGIYILQVLKDGKLIYNQKVIKE